MFQIFVLHEVYSDSGFRLVSHHVVQVCLAGIKKNDVVATDEAWNVGHVIDCVETNAESSDFVDQIFFRLSTKLLDVDEVRFREFVIVVCPESAAMASFHAGVNKSGH